MNSCNWRGKHNSLSRGAEGARDVYAPARELRPGTGVPHRCWSYSCYEFVQAALCRDSGWELL